MARRYEVHSAFTDSIRVDSRGRQTVSTVDFVRTLAAYNHDWSLREANVWIEHYQSMFRDISTEEGERRTFFLTNMGYVAPGG
ncbi:hypothetical protein [Erwinia oleae]|uniref:hypothetical protein n=1 Tax=Erwinia oleae TaxID=796334 RepID=UPI0005570B6E|nr:hypothetical protein [Erwinia oleae]